MKKVCVIGGGPAGLMAAYAAGNNGHQVVLIEKNEKLGKKIYITGKGRCNFTNDVPPADFLPNVVRGEKFLRGAIYSFSSQNTIQFLEKHGLSVKIERGNRAFPVSDHASDVTKTLEKACKSVGVDVHLNEKVEKITSITPEIIPMPDIVGCAMQDKTIMSGEVILKRKKKQDLAIAKIAEVHTNKGVYAFDEVIVATGGISYPSTGSTGDGYIFARSVGHCVTDLKCGLCGLNLEGAFFKELQGLTLKNVAISVRSSQKCVYSDFGELLFTHFGVSGPIVLSASSVINRQNFADLSLVLDLKPALDEQTLDKRLLRDFEKYKNKHVSNALCELLPQKMIAIVLETSGVSERKAVNVLTKEERARLVQTIKNLSFKIKSLRGFEEAIVTSGGVSLGEIDPKTMESKLVKGLKFCGEVLDVDAFTGGFNMQIAFSTGYIAGNTIK